MSAVLQRFLSGSSSSEDGGGSGGGGLTDTEKEQLLQSVKKEVEEISKTDDTIEKDFKKIKNDSDSV